MEPLRNILKPRFETAGERFDLILPVYDEQPELDRERERSAAENASHADWISRFCISRSSYMSSTRNLNKKNDGANFRKIVGNKVCN